MAKRLSIEPGQRFGRLVVLREAEKYIAPCGQPQRQLRLKCDCGQEVIVNLASLRSGNTTSCRCYRREMMVNFPIGVTHGMTGTPVYNSWLSMMERVNGRDADKARNYRDRGITVCARWLSFENFYADMGDRPTGMTINRRDNDGPYAPWNCEWADQMTQSANRRTNRMVMLKGETICLREAARRLRIDPCTAPDMAKREAISLQAAIDKLAARGGGRSKRVLTL